MTEPPGSDGTKEAQAKPLLSEQLETEKENAKVFLLNCGAAAYNLVMTYFRAQGALCDYKRLVLRHLRYLMLVSEGRHKAVAKKVYYDSILQKVAEKLNPGVDVDESWKVESDLSAHSITLSDRLSASKDLTRFADALNYEQSLHASALRQSQHGQKRRASDSISDLSKLGIKRKRPCLRNSPMRAAMNVLKLRIRKVYETRKRLPQPGNKLNGIPLRSTPYPKQQTADGCRMLSLVCSENRLKERSTNSKKSNQKELDEAPMADGEKVPGNLPAPAVHYEECQSSEGENLSIRPPERSALSEKERPDKSPPSKLDLFDDGCVYNQLFSEHYGKIVKEKRKTCGDDGDKMGKDIAASKSSASEGLPTLPKQNSSPRLSATEVPDFISPIDLLLSSNRDRYRNQSGSANSIQKEIAPAYPKESNSLQLLKNRRFLASAVEYWESTANSGKSNLDIKHEIMHQQSSLPGRSMEWRQNSVIPGCPRILKARAISRPILNGKSLNYDLSRNSFNAAVAPYGSREANLATGGCKTRKLILTRRPESFHVSHGALRAPEKPKFRIINRNEDRPAACKVTSFFAADSRINVVRMPVIRRVRGRFERSPSAPTSIQASSAGPPGRTVLCSKSGSSASTGRGPGNDSAQTTGTVKSYSVASQRPTTGSDSQASTPSPSTRTFSLIRPVTGAEPPKSETDSTYRLLPASIEGKTYKVRLQVNSANGAKAKPTEQITSNSDNCTLKAASCPTGVRLIGKTASKRLPGVKVAFWERRNDERFGSKTSSSDAQ